MRCLHRSHYAMHPLITSCEASIALLMRCIHYSYHAMNLNLPSNTANHANPWISGILFGQLLGSSDRYHASAASALKHQWFATDPKTASTDRSARAHHCSPRQRSRSIAVPAHVLIAVQAQVLRSKCRAPCGLTAVPRATRCSNRTSAPSPRRSSRPRRLAGDRALGSDAPLIFPRPSPTAAAPSGPTRQPWHVLRLVPHVSDSASPSCPRFRSAVSSANSFRARGHRLARSLAVTSFGWAGVLNVLLLQLRCGGKCLVQLVRFLRIND